MIDGSMWTRLNFSIQFCKYVPWSILALSLLWIFLVLVLVLVWSLLPGRSFVSAAIQGNVGKDFEAD